MCLICWHFFRIILFSCSFCLLSQLMYLFIWSGFWFAHAGLGAVMTIAFVIRGLCLRVESSYRRRIGFSVRSECWRIKRKLRSVILPRPRFASFSPFPLLLSYIINELSCFSPRKGFKCRFKHFFLNCRRICFIFDERRQFPTNSLDIIIINMNEASRTSLPPGLLTQGLVS